MVLTTKGAKSGQDRQALVNYSQDGDRWVIVASKSGSPTNPDWYHNLLTYPEARVEAEKEAFQMRSAEVKGEDRDRLYEQHATEYPQFREYPTKTDRMIPVFVLHRVRS